MSEQSERNVRAREQTLNNALTRNPLYADILIYFVLFLSAVITLEPMLNVFARSFSPPHIISKYPMMILPQQFTTEAYNYIFSTSTLVRSFWTSVFITVVGTALSLAVTITGAYSLSKVATPGNKLMMTFVVIAMLFGAGLIPSYIVINKLGLINTVWVLVLPFLASPYNMILMRNFFWSVPGELEDSARIDGASEMRVLLSVILPLSKPAIATIGLFYAVGHWNDFYRALFYINDTALWPLPMMLRSIVVENNMTSMGQLMDVQKKFVNPDNIKAATIVFATVPILVVYPFIQKYFVQGVMLGAIKG